MSGEERYEIHDVSCDMDVDCTCGASELLEEAEAWAALEEAFAHMNVAISQPGESSALVISFCHAAPLTATFAHPDFGPIEI